MATRGWLAAALLLLAGLFAPAAGLAAPRIGVMTMQPGEIFFERFGHDSIVVLDTATGDAISYNFGSFDPTEPGFLGRIEQGQMETLLGDRPYLLGDRFSVADAYLYVVLGWLAHFDIDLGRWPALAAHQERVGNRPAVQAARQAEKLR